MLKLNTAISSQINRSMVLSVIHRNPLISRAQIADRTGLDRSAITHILKELLDRGLVEEVEEGRASARGGRRPVHLRVRYDARRLIALEMGTESLNVAVTNLGGQVLWSRGLPAERGVEPVGLLMRALEMVRAEDGKAFAEALAIAISSPGIVDHEKGAVLLNLFHGWRNVNLKDPLERAFGKAVLVENDANAAALAEWAHHEAMQTPGLDSLVYLMIRGRGTGPGLPLGIGGAFVQKGRLWHGAHYCSGEIAPAISSRFERVLQEHGLGELTTAATTETQNALTGLMKGVERGEPQAIQAMSVLSKILGEFLAELATFMDPHAIVVSMLPPQSCAPFMEALQENFRRHYDMAGLGRVRLLAASRQSGATLEGLLALALERVFIRDRTEPSLLFI